MEKKEQLLDELADLLVQDDINIDIAAIDRVLDELDKISPFPDFTSDEESLALFHERHKDWFQT